MLFVLEKEHSTVSFKLKHSCNKCVGKHNIAICIFSKDKTNLSLPVSTTDAKLPNFSFFSSKVTKRRIRRRSARKFNQKKSRIVTKAAENYV